MKRRGLSLFLCLILALGLAACGQGTQNPNAKQPSADGSATKAPEGKTDASQASSTSEYAEHVKISYAAVGMTEGLDYNADDLSKIFLDKFNMEWDTIGLTWDNWAEKVRIWVNANDMPDFVMMNFNYTDMKNYAEQGLLRQMPEGWETKYPNLYRIHKDTGIGEAVAERVGGVYMLPRIIYYDMPTDPLVSHMSLWYRADWAKAVGLTPGEKITVNQLVEMAKLFKEKNPGGESSGKNVPLSINASDLAEVFLANYNINYNGYYKADDGKYHWGGEDPKTLEGLKVYQQAYKDGLLNPDFFALKNGEEKDEFNTGRAGAIFNGGFAKIVKDTYPKFQTNNGVDPFEAIQLAYLCNNDGLYANREITNFWSISIFSPTMSDVKFTRLLDLLEYSASDEGQTLIRFGIEGKDWKKDAEGKIEVTREKLEDGTFKNPQDIYPSLNPVYNNLTVLPDDFSMNDPTTDPRILSICKTLFDGKQKDGFDKGALKPVDYDLTLFSGPNFDKVSLNYGDEYARLIVAEGDLEANWKAWIAEKRPQIDAVLGELNAAYAK